MLDLLGKLVDPVSNILDKVVEDKDQKAKLAHEIATMAERHAQELARGQIEINKEEAKSRNIFIAGLASVCWMDLRVGVVLALLGSTRHTFCDRVV